MRVSEEERSVRDGVDMQQFSEVSRTRTTYSTETHKSAFLRSEMGSQCSFFFFFSRRGVEWR